MLRDGLGVRGFGFRDEVQVVRLNGEVDDRKGAAVVARGRGGGRRGGTGSAGEERGAPERGGVGPPGRAAPGGAGGRGFRRREVARGA